MHHQRGALDPTRPAPTQGGLMAPTERPQGAVNVLPPAGKGASHPVTPRSPHAVRQHRATKTGEPRGATKGKGGEAAAYRRGEPEGATVAG